MKAKCKTCGCYWDKSDPGDTNPFLQSAVVVDKEIHMLPRYSDRTIPIYEFVIRLDHVKEGLICDNCIGDLLKKGNIKYYDGETSEV